MIYRLVAGVLAALAVAIIVPAQAHAEPPTQCLTNTPKGKQVYVPCDLLNAGANFPPGQRCPEPLDQYPKDVQDWCGTAADSHPPSPKSYEPDKSDESDEPDESDESCEPDEPDEPDESYQPDEPDESYEPGQ